MSEETVEKLEELEPAYILSHPARATIIRYLKETGEAYPAKISKELGLNERVVSFHLSMLSSGGFVDSRYALSNPSRRVVKYYKVTAKVDEAMEILIRTLGVGK